jgi:hypothetical protein
MLNGRLVWTKMEQSHWFFKHFKDFFSTSIKKNLLFRVDLVSCTVEYMYLTNLSELVNDLGDVT